MYNLVLKETNNKEAQPRTVMIEDTKTKTITEAVAFLMNEKKCPPLNLRQPTKDQKSRMNPKLVKMFGFVLTEETPIEGRVHVKHHQFYGEIIKADL